MFFMGTSQGTLQGLSYHLSQIDERINGMTFYELPFCNVEDFDYPGIARMIDEDGADIIWVALGAPKQEIFMSRLKPYLKRGVMIAVGAAFKFYSGTDVKRAPHWMVKMHLEFAYRIFSEPKKQLKRCGWICIYTSRIVVSGMEKKETCYQFHSIITQHPDLLLPSRLI